ncbi:MULTISPECIES: ATP-binding protein [unclassified Streptomyces]|uniref:ATP-binding protein n=1 Tax=unclassified Streptomyces TaxID=2593676 RepID=UPI003720DC74
MSTTRAYACIALTPQEIEQWPDTPVASALAAGWPRSRSTALCLPAVDRAVPVCRYLTRLWLDQQHLTDEGVRHTALLIITELATNAILHTNSTIITTELQQKRSHLLIQMRDQGTERTVKHWHANSGFGRGLGIIANCTRSLGTHVEDDGTRTIWATVSLTRQAPVLRSLRSG